MVINVFYNIHYNSLFLFVPSTAKTSDLDISLSYMCLIMCIIVHSSYLYQVWLTQVIVEYPGHICDL